MGKEIYTSYEISYHKCFSLEYFHESTEDFYIDEKKYKIVSKKFKEITDNDLSKDWLWQIKVYNVSEVKNG